MCSRDMILGSVVSIKVNKGLNWLPFGINITKSF